MWRLSLLLLGCFIGGSAVGQTDLQLYRAEYPDDGALLTRRIQRVFYDIIDEELRVSEETEVEYLMLKTGNSGYAKDDIGYNSFSRIEDLEAYSLVPNEKGKYKRLKVETFNERDEFTEGIFHDDARSIQFHYPSIDAGTRIGYRYKRVHLMPEVTSSLFLVNQTPALEYVFELHVALGVNERLAFFNVDSNDLRIEHLREPRKRVIRITKDETLGLRIASGATPIGDWAPHVIVHPESYVVNGTEVRVLKEYTDLAAWYEHKLQIVDTYDTELVLPEVERLLEGVTTTDEKLRRIYRYTQDQIKYVAFEDGLGGFVPRNANAVLARKFGDCKDMSYLMYEMCKAAGIPAYLTWVGTRDIPYSYFEMPTPIVDNHMILTAGDPDSPDELYWLDATASTWEFGVPTTFIQGKEAMVRIGPEDYRIVNVPIVDAEYNTLRERVRLRIKDKTTIEGSGTLEISGDYRASFTDRFARLKKDGKADSDAMRGFLEKGNNSFKLKDYSVEYPEEYTGHVSIEHDFEVNNYLLNTDDELIVNLNVSRFWEDFAMEDDREQPYAFEMTTRYDYTTEFEIPDGYVIESLPSDRAFEGSDFGFRFEYRAADGMVKYRQTLDLNRLTLDPADFSTWNKMIKELNRGYRDAVVFKRIR